ncbi:DinB family protein [Actinoplanes sp. CA-142083]|uniref:DinB family protein n=1 Tax=Actinoplanes sp. CA-142083 TaxID=3239903 RepID=UPI003D8BF52E
MNADEVRRAVSLARETLSVATERDWRTVPAAGLEWTCWETLEHVSDALFGYAAQLGPAKPSVTTYVPFGWRQNRPGGPYLTIYGDHEQGGQAGLLEVFETCGALLAAMVQAVPAGTMSFHNYGASDPGGFAAMGVVEVLVHTHDVAGGLGLPWAPPDDLVAGALDRLFPSAPGGFEPWPTLLWCTGRAGLPGRPAPESWKWDGRPRVSGSSG